MIKGLIKLKATKANSLSSLIKFNTKMKGYEICMRINGYDCDTFLYVDEEKKVRSICNEDGLENFTEEEKWNSDRIQGSLEGIIRKDLQVAVIKNNKLIKWNDHYLYGKIKSIKEVDIKKEIASDPGIAGIDRPVFKPNSTN